MPYEYSCIRVLFIQNLRWIRALPQGFRLPSFLCVAIVLHPSTAPQTAPCCAAVSLCAYPSTYCLPAPPRPSFSAPHFRFDLPSRPLLVQNTVSTLLAADGLALVDADLDATLGAEVVHGGKRGCLAVRAAAWSGGSVLFAR